MLIYSGGLFTGLSQTNRHVAHLDPTTGEGCSFCGEPETIEHLFLECNRLWGLLGMVEGWCTGLQTGFSWQMYIGGPRYRVKEKGKVCLLNFLFGQAKLATWLGRKNRRLGTGSDEAGEVLRGLVAARLQLEFAYYSLVKKIPEFLLLWGIDGVLCHVDGEGSLDLHV